MAGPPSPRPLRRRLRFKIGTLMIVVAITAVAAWGYAMKRRWDAAVLDHARASDRLQWAEKMYEKRYVSKAQLVDAQLQFERTKRQLGE